MTKQLFFLLTLLIYLFLIPVISIAQDFNSLLLKGITENNIEAVKDALLNGADVNAKYTMGYSALMVAVLNDHRQIITLLIEKGANPEQRSDDGKYALDLVKEPEVILLFYPNGIIPTNAQEVLKTLDDKKREIKKILKLARIDTLQYAILKSYVIGKTTIGKFKADGWNISDPVYQKLGIISEKRDEDLITYILGFYQNIEKGEESKVAELIKRNFLSKVTYSAWESEEIKSYDISPKYLGEHSVTQDTNGKINSFVISPLFGLYKDVKFIEVCSLEFRNNVLINIRFLDQFEKL